MPTTAKSSNATKSKTNGSRDAMHRVSTSGQGKSANNKKQGAVNVKTTSARDKAKNFDEGRRNDANSNGL